MISRLYEICAALEIRLIPTTKRREPMETCAVQTLDRILQDYGAGHLTIVLRSITETENNKMALVAPVIWAVSDIILAHPSWVDTGSAWLDAMDTVNLVEMFEHAKTNRDAVPTRHGVAVALYDSLRRSFHVDQQERLL